jgi:fumarate reductase flavoprotein subunit
MTATHECDVVVVGGGIAGLAAANRAAEQGLDVVLLERGAGERYLCNSRYSGGIVHVAFRNVKDPPAELARTIAAATRGYADEVMVQALAQTCGRAVDWLRGEGAKFMRVGQAAWQQWVLAPPPPVRAGLNWQGRGSDYALHTLARKFAARGGRLLRGTAATALMERDRHCIGVEATDASGAHVFNARAVVLADGGFQGNPDLIGRHICRVPGKLRQRGASTGIGDGMRMAQALGAQLTDLGAFYGHTLCRDAMTDDGLWPFPHLDDLCTAGIVVDGAGRRFVDEGLGGVHATNAIAQLPDPLAAWVVFDETIWSGPGRVAVTPANPHLVKAGGTVYQAQTLHQLAAQSGIAAETLLATVAQYCAALGASRLAELDPPRTVAARPAFAVAQAPFYAIPLCAGITYTMGGIATDGDGRVLRPDGHPIGGLYAAGATTGGLEGGPGCAYVGGLIKSLTFGLRAGEHAAQTIKGEPRS